MVSWKSANKTLKVNGKTSGQYLFMFHPMIDWEKFKFEELLPSEQYLQIFVC